MQKVIHGECLEVMKSIEDNSIDFIVCDPPYGLNFMGKHWDRETPNVEIWKECLRICKPGSMLAAFGGSRTHHHLMIALEKAGWEVRDVVMWIYSQGFPKSHNKFGLDGYGTALKPAHEEIIIVQKPLSLNTEQDIIVESLIKLWNQLCLMLPANVAEKIFMLNNLDMNAALDFAHINANQKSSIQDDLCALMDMSQLEKVLISCLNIVSLWKTTLEDLWKPGSMSTTKTETNQIIDLKILNYYLCQLTPLSIIQEETKALGSWLNVLPAAQYLNAVVKNINATQELIALENAISKDGIDALTLGIKPAYEPIIICMKPLDGTYANNVEKWGLGGINIDSSRISTDDNITNHSRSSESSISKGIYGNSSSQITHQTDGQKLGRWPANIILDESAAEQLDLFTGVLKSGGGVKNPIGGATTGFHTSNWKDSGYRKPDSGGASRFFYCAKASPSERNKGLESQTRVIAMPNGTLTLDLKNSHPTVKPISLMKYIITLLAPPNNPTLLDPFCGSGSTLIAAKELGISAIGIEREKEYCEIAEKRIAAH